MADEASGIDLGIGGLGPAEHIGRGGFADVYRAEQLSLRRTVAVKVLRSPASTPETHARFQRECHAIGAVSDHPHIVGVHDSGLTSNGRAYLVMEYLPGGSLADRLRDQGPLPIAQVVATTAKIARALAVAHRGGVLHRDVKPANIMISAYGEPALGDFGIARIDGGHQTVTGQVTASIVHASPEVLEGHSPSPATDIYSLGSTLFELAVGRAPYYDPTDESMWPVMKRILSEPMPTPESVGFSPALGLVFRRATARSPLDRYQDADDMADALEALLDDPTALTLTPAGPGLLDRNLDDPDRTALIDSQEMTARSTPVPQLTRPDLTAVQVPAVGQTYGAPLGGVRSLPGPPGPGLADRLAVPATIVLAVAAIVSAVIGLLLPALDDDPSAGIEVDPGARTIQVVGAADGPLQAGAAYPVEVPDPPAGSTFRLVVDGLAQGPPGPTIPDLVASAGLQRVQVELVTPSGTERTAPVEVVAASEPTPGFRATLAILPATPVDLPGLVEAFVALEADGHEGLELLATDRVAGVTGGAWMLSVPGFDDGATAETYCRNFELPIPDRCYAGLVEPVAS